MGNSQSSGIKSATAALPPPPSPFLSSPTDKSGVIARLVSSLSSATITQKLPKQLILLLSLITGQSSSDLRLFFSPTAFTTAFPDHSDVREDLIGFADIVRYHSQPQYEGPDSDYYLLAKLSTLQHPSRLMELILSGSVEGIFTDVTILQIDLKARLSVVTVIYSLLNRISNCLPLHDDVPSLSFLRGTLNKFEFLYASLSLLVLQNVNLANNWKLIHDYHGDLEDTLLNVLLVCTKSLFSAKRYSECLELCISTYELFDRYSVALLPINQLLFIQCKCAIWMGNMQMAVSLSEAIEVDEQIVLLMSEQPNGILSQFELKQSHYYYYLMGCSVDANVCQLIVHFGRIAFNLIEMDNDLFLVISTMVFVTLLDEHEWSEAYESIQNIPTVDRQKDCVKRFIGVLCEHESIAGDVLCSLPLVGSFDTVEETLLLKARQSGNFTFHHNLLFILYMNHGDYRGAAGVMYRLADRHSIREDRKRALLLTVTCLELVHTDFQWIAMTKEIKNDNQLFILTLADIRNELNECEDMQCLLDNMHYDIAFSRISTDQDLLLFIQHFVSLNDERLLPYLDRLSMDKIHFIKPFLSSTEWLKAYYKQKDINGYINMYENDTVTVLADHIQTWREYKEKRKMGMDTKRPSSLISQTVVMPAALWKYTEYLQEIQ